MVGLSLKVVFSIVYIIDQLLMNFASCGCCSWCPPVKREQDRKFEQKSDKFWEFEEGSNRWVEVSLPFDLISCINESCTKVGSIESKEKKKKDIQMRSGDYEHDEPGLPVRKRVSLTLMTESSVWITGQSGSIFERFWNGVQWVIAPHELPTSAGHAVSVFIVNQTILSLSEAGLLYQLQLNEHSQPIWTKLELMPETNMDDDAARREESPSVQIKSGLVSHDRERLYVTTTDGTLLEVSEVQPLRWNNHGRPPGGDVSAVADAGAIRPGVVFIVSSNGDLYEFDKKSKPSWKKHIWSEELAEEISLIALPGSTIQGLVGAHSVSLFLLTKDGLLIERCLHKRKWKWRVHGAPEGQYLSSITAVEQHEPNEKNSSLFLTTTTGLLFKYQLPKHSVHFQGNKIDGLWVNHMHPHHAKVARGIRGVQMQLGRMIFALDDGRLGELHFPGIGGESHGPNQQISLRRKASNQYEWSVLEVPETEGWNAEYCTDERGLSNCILGIKDMPTDDDPNDSSSTIPAKRRKVQERLDYISLSNHDSSTAESSNLLTKSINTNFRMRAMHVDKSFFIITKNGQTFEYLYTDHVWLWLNHEHSTEMKGALGSYNGSLFFVDTHGSLLMRERNGNELSWINCTAMRKGRQVATGPPWDRIPGGMHRVTADDALFFVNKKGRLIQFTVALRNFKWKDCGHPSDTKVVYIIDQEALRMHIVFVIGRNGRIYQYNKLTELWHGHYQSPHLVLSRTPGTAMRPSYTSLTGSLFMISEHGGLVEYQWSSADGWEWVEHGTPSKDVTLVGAPGPCFDGTQLFVIGSDGQVYRRHLDQKAWKWAGHDHPKIQNAEQGAMARTKDDHQQCSVEDKARRANGFSGNCNEKVAPTRPIPLSEDAVIFELQDGRLAELRRPSMTEEWEWVRIIGTPASQCLSNYWTAVAS